MSELKRYDMEIDGCYDNYHIVTREEPNIGDWVKFDDHVKALESSRQRISELEQCVKVAEEALKTCDSAGIHEQWFAKDKVNDALSAIVKIRGKDD